MAEELDVSIIVPCFNEEGHIGPFLENVRCLVEASALRVEVLLADGMSDDGTRALLSTEQARWPVLKVFDNNRRFAAPGLNLLIGMARGRHVARLDVHARYPDGYLATLATWLDAHPDVGCCGGYLETRPGADTPAARAIALLMSSRFGVGGSEFRTERGRERDVKTVPFGFFRKAALEAAGGYDQALARNEDEELAGRLIARGWRVVIVPDVVSTYFARRNLRELAGMMFQYGLYKPLAGVKAGALLSLRQFVPAALVLAIAGGFGLGLAAHAWWPLGGVLGAYAVFVAAGTGSAYARTAGEGSRWVVTACFGLCLPVAHLSYGAGFLRGLVGLPSLAAGGGRPRVTR